uniref:Uncharacterized protein n=1 Tax=viral metagenome TaxID=1070528 RepID=A0A6M3K0H4_9ZZZZ
MPGGNISVVERHKKLQQIQELSEEGLSDQQIADKVGMSLTAVKRNQKYIEELHTADLTPEDVASKRAELYLELVEASNSAKSLLDAASLKDNKISVDIKRYFDMWMQSISMKMKLYGLESIKVDNMLQINTQFNSNTDVNDKLDSELRERLAKMIIKSHEEKSRDRWNEKV